MRMLERRDGDGAQPDEADDGVAHGVAADVVGPAAGDRLVVRAWSTCDLRWIESLSIFVPARPSRPGSSVIAAAIATATTSATATPIEVMAGSPARNRPRMAMTTVVPAKSTGLAGGGVRGAGRVLDAHAVVQVLAVAGDDEQRVVDADAEADHHAQDQRELRHVDERRQHADAGGADEDAHRAR